MKILIQIPRRLMRKRFRWAIVGLLILVGIAVGVGWVLTDRQPSTFEGKDTLAVNAPIKNEAQVSQDIQFSTERVQPQVRGENYFVNYRLQRDQFRQEEKNMLSAVLNSNVDKTKEAAQEKWLELTTRMSREDKIENLLKIKGFQDAVVDLASESVNIIVLAPSLSPQEVAAIQDITMRVVPVRLDRINISLRK